MNPDRNSLIAAVHAERPEINVVGAVLHEGRQNVVLETHDGWIVRFPRDAAGFDREVRTLRRVVGRLPASVPEVEWVGQRTSFAIYRKLSGHTFDRAAYQRASPAQRDVLADSLAGFLAAMHDSLAPEEINDLQIPDYEPGGANPTLPFAGLCEDVRRFAVDLVDEADSLRAERLRVAKPKVVLHNDFHFWNMVLSAPIGKVAGVWDFSCVALGDPSDDLRYIPNDSCDLMRRLARHYERRTGTRIDLRAATLANRIEVVFDAIERGRTAGLREVVRRWQRAESDLPRDVV